MLLFIVSLFLKWQSVGPFSGSGTDIGSWPIAIILALVAGGVLAAEALGVDLPGRFQVTSLAAYLMSLLVFYVITTSFVQEAAVTVDRPGSAGATAVTGGFVAVAVTKGGVIQVGERVVDLLALSEVVAAARRDQACDRVVVVADRDVTTGLLLQVLDGCRAGGAGDVQVAATAP